MIPRIPKNSSDAVMPDLVRESRRLRRLRSRDRSIDLFPRGRRGANMCQPNRGEGEITLALGKTRAPKKLLRPARHWTAVSLALATALVISLLVAPAAQAV